ncbi:MAG: hypothetical protein OES24_07045 [Acidimicrobiia bacterium]|nr:hypothetical protein [Acidimicrobiia bacterium]
MSSTFVDPSIAVGSQGIRVKHVDGNVCEELPGVFAHGLPGVRPKSKPSGDQSAI